MKSLYLKTVIITAILLVYSIVPCYQPPQVLATPDTESLWSGSNAVSDPAELTLTSSTNADGSGTGTWANTSGGWTDPISSWTFIITNHATGSGTINSAALYLKHYTNGWINDDYLIQIYDGSSWHDVRSYSAADGPPGSDTTDNWDVSSYLDTWTKVDDAQVRIIGEGKLGPEETVTWFVDTVEIRVDYTVPPDISNTPSTYGFGIVTAGSTTETGLTYFTLTNNSGFVIDVTISATDMTGGATWTLSDTATPGADTYGLLAGLEGGSYSIIVKKTATFNSLVTGLAGSGGTQSWGLQLLAPTSFSDGAAKTGTITITAVAQ